MGIKSINIEGKNFKPVSVESVTKGDFIKVGENVLVEILDIEYQRNERGAIKNWNVKGTDGKDYGMDDVGLYLRSLE